MVRRWSLIITAFVLWVLGGWEFVQWLQQHPLEHNNDHLWVTLGFFTLGVVMFNRGHKQ